MLRKRFFTSRPLVLLLALLVVWWLLLPTLGSFLKLTFFEFQAPLWTVPSYVKDLGEYWTLTKHSPVDLVEAGRDLARLNAAYELKLQEYGTLSDELQRLESILSLSSNARFRYEIARVSRRDQSSWWQQIIIRKGRLHGIREGAAVVYGGGVAGRVREVYQYSAVIELISSATFRIAAHLEGDMRPATYRGGRNLSFQPASGSVTNVQSDILIASDAPLRLVTSRLGGVFPDGLTIGWVDYLDPGSDGLFQSGQVRLDTRLLALREVAVLIPLEEERKL